jgi:hypothetical protein
MVDLRSPGRLLPLVLLLLAGLASFSGCVERRYTVRTNPPGALLVANDEEIGATPTSRSFTYYGDRKFKLMLDGHETQTVIQPIKAPWWDNYLTEFFTENLIPYTFRDEREYVYQMSPKSEPNVDTLLENGQGLRMEAQAPPPPRRKGFFAWLGF